MYEPIFDEFTAPMDDSSMFDYDEVDRDAEDDEDEWECAFPGECLNPHFLHTRDECFTLQMAEDAEREALES